MNQGPGTRPENETGEGQVISGLKSNLRRLETEFRHRVRQPVEYRLGLAEAGLRRMVRPGGRTIRFLVVSDGREVTSEQQFAPMRHHAAALRRELGVVFRPMRLAEAMRLGPDELRRYDVIGLKLSFRVPEAEAVGIVAGFRERVTGSGTKLVYFDGDDDACVQWPEVLRAVDLYVKKGVFTSKDDYLRTFAGKTNLTDYVAKTYGVPVPTDITRSGTLHADDLPRLHLGWSTALDDKHKALHETLRPHPPEKKDVDILCRASMPKDWSAPLRGAVGPALEPLRDRRRLIVSVPTNRVPWDEYYNELRRARICVSPFGYGEVCGRDIECTLAGCLLVKPDMSHLGSDPNIFAAGETYVPVRWDYADLVETVERYLDDEPERARIAGNAYRVLSDSYRAETFVTRIRALLDRIGLDGASAPEHAKASVASGAPG